MAGIWFTRWAKSSSFTQDEFKVIEKLVPQTSALADKLLKQAKHAPYVVRRVVGSAGYEATIPHLTDDSLLVAVGQDIESPSLEAIDNKTGRHLQFSTAILRGGFLVGVKGCALDGKPWPKKWSVGAGPVATSAVLHWLDGLRPDPATEPANACLKDLANWCQANPRQLSDFHVQRLNFVDHATAEQIMQCEERLGTCLPEPYKDLVRIANGFEIRHGRPYLIHGTEEIDFLDDQKEWLGITPLYEDGYVAMRSGDELATCFLLAPHSRAEEIGPIQQHVRESLEWKDCDGKEQ